MSKQILVIGSGGREHALCWKLQQSPEVSTVYCSPGNGGIARDATCVSLPSIEDVICFAKENHINLIVIGPEQPLVDGWSDALRTAGFTVFGPSQAASALEGSKAFTKQLCKDFNIPTGAYEVFTDAESAKAYLDGKRYPLVIKADGLAAGKGVIIAQHESEALEAITNMFSGNFGAAGETIVIEEFLTGEEVSVFALSDGEHVRYFGHAQDHKRAFDGDSGPNTGGMGTYTPAPLLTDVLQQQIMGEIVIPVIQGMKTRGTPYQGVLFAGIMVTADGPQLLEINCRFGDPEAQVLFPRLKTDILPLLEACATGHSLPDVALNFYNEAALCVVMATQGYPGTYTKGSIIRGIDDASIDSDVVIFHAGTKLENGEYTAQGGRVLGVVGMGEDVRAAQKETYTAITRINWPEGFYRKDIGWRAIEAE